jgi:hypothetical protein
MLALNTSYKSLPPISSKDVDIRLDAGPVFHPTKMHIEGEEPIALAIVLDASGDQKNLLRTLPDSAEAMATSSLRSHDRLTLYAVDCKIIRSSLNFPVGPLLLHSAVSRALSAPNLHEGKDQGRCGRSLRLWDTAALALKALAQQPGRRVLIIVSAGDDHKSVLSWNMLRNYADDNSIAIFGLRDLEHFAGDSGTQLHVHEAGVYYSDKAQDEDHYRELCQATGGLILTTPASQLTASLERLIAMMRGRYILEFPRAANATAGRHTVDVSLPYQLAYIVTSGTTVDMPDEALDKDPTTVHTAPSPAIMGTRRVLPDKH